MIALTELTRRSLGEAGWTERYTWDPPGWREAVRSEGFRVSEVASEFLGRFGGLRLERAEATFDPVAAARDSYATWAAEYERRLDVPVSLVGTAYRDHMLIWLADDGRMCLSFDDDFQVIGDDPMDGLNGLCEGNDYQVTRARRHLAAADKVQS